jgi:hypothetical protein
MRPVYILILHFNTNLPLTNELCRWYFPLTFLTKIVYAAHISSMHATCPLSHPSYFYNTDNIWWYFCSKEMRYCHHLHKLKGTAFHYATLLPILWEFWYSSLIISFHLGISFLLPPDTKTNFVTKMWQADVWPAKELEVLCTIRVTAFELGNIVWKGEDIVSWDFCCYRNLLVYELNSFLKDCS